MYGNIAQKVPNNDETKSFLNDETEKKTWTIIESKVLPTNIMLTIQRK